MKKTIVFSCLSLFLYAQDDYVPLSGLSDAKKIEYNFVETKKKVQSIDKEEYKALKIEDNKYETVSEIKEVEIKEDIIENNKNIEKIEELKENKNIINNNLVKEYKNSNILQDSKKTENNLNNIQFSAQVIYSPLSANASSSITNQSKKSNVIVPQIEFKINEHKLNAEYFYVKNKFLSGDFETTLYKFGYKYNYLNANLGLNLNYLEVDSNVFLTGEELYPSIEMDFFYNIENIKLAYGLGVGTGSDVNYSIDYFLSAEIKPYSLSDAAFVAGYINKTIQFDDDFDLKIEYKGPYIGVRSVF